MDVKANEDRNMEDLIANLPKPVLTSTAGYKWERDTIGKEGSAVYRLHGKPDAPDIYLKHGEGSVADSIYDEHERLKWLTGRISVPTILQFCRKCDEAWLLVTARPGKSALQALQEDVESRPEIVDALAGFLRELHGLPARDCPFDGNHNLRLVEARKHIDAGMVDIDDFDAERIGWTAEQVWSAIQERLPITPQSVVTHGDFSLDNVFLDNGKVTGCIDLGRMGVADLYQDLAILWNALGEVELQLRHRLIRAYGLSHVDEQKLRFHIMLDELF